MKLAQGQEKQGVRAFVDCPGAQGLYSYTIPEHCVVSPGDILSVIFGTQHVGAIAVEVFSLSDLGQETDEFSVPIAQLRPIQDVMCAGFFPPSYWKLLQWTAHFYQTPLMQVVRSALPPGLLSRSQRRLKLLKRCSFSEVEDLGLSDPAQQIVRLLLQSKAGEYAWRFIQQRIHPPYRAVQELIQREWVVSYLQPPEVMRSKQQSAITLIVDPRISDPNVGMTDRHREILTILQRLGGDVWVKELLTTAKTTLSVLKTLEKKGYVVLQMREVLRQDRQTVLPDRPQPLTADQALVLERLHPLQSTAQVLLHGVTGSGKTELYLQAIAPRLAAGYSALVLVPEIGLTPQLTDRFRARFGNQVLVYHSALSEGERYDTWRQMQSDDAKVVIGTRSAVFAPLSKLGLIVLDEEHDASFKQDQPAPCYHARTVAQWRSQLENCPIILGSATPSLESWQHSVQPSLNSRPAETGPQNEAGLTALPSPAYYLSLPRRVFDRPHPQVQVVDMRQELASGNRSIFSQPLREALVELQETDRQGLLFIHRRGHSTHVSCRSCGYVMECPNCDVSLAYHQSHASAPELLRCHYCGYTQVQPTECPVCHSGYFKHFGSGTQRVMQSLSQEFPTLRCLRFDSDTTRTKGAHRLILEQFARHEADLLVGTQMLTKGLDLPQVTLVGIVAADGLLHLQDFRSAERAVQTLLQVAGRAGRGDEPGRVILQTYTPDHPVIETVVGQDYAAFAHQELETRRILGYPPVGRLVLLRLSSPDATAVQQAATTTAQRFRDLQLSALREGDRTSDCAYEVLGPSPAAVSRLAQRYRWQVILKLASSTPVEVMLQDLDRNLPSLRKALPKGVSLSIDVDPLSFM